MHTRTFGRMLVAALFAALPSFAMDAPPLTEDGGQPVGDNQNSRTAGPRGSVLLDNFHLIQKLARFDRERIPERVVHARGVGAHGEFVSYGDWSAHTKADLFSAEGKRTPIFLRFSTVIHPKGSPEQLRDPRGFAVKFYTNEGNWDLVGNNLPVFFIRDAIKFPDMVHSLKPSPITNQQDPNRFFDFFSHVPESTHMLTFLYSNQGTPGNLRQMDGFGVHAYKWVNAAGEVTYVKFNWRSLQGHAPLSAMTAAKSAAANHTGYTADLYESIARGEFPAWELAVQMLKTEQLDDFDYDPLDATKTWNDVPEMKIGRMTLNRIPDNFFQETEQVAFSPGMVVPGIEPSEDRLLQGRLFSYADTQRYRLGGNYLALPVNRPVATVTSYNQDGQLNHGTTTSDVNYQPSVVDKAPTERTTERYSQAPLVGQVQQQRIEKTLDYQQAGVLYRGFTADERAHLVQNFAGDLGRVANRQVKLRILSFLFQADEDYGRSVAEAVGERVDDVKRMIAANREVESTRWQTIALAESGSSDTVIVRNTSARPIRYRTRTAASSWSNPYTLLPNATHTYDSASIEIRRIDIERSIVLAGIGDAIDLGALPRRGSAAPSAVGIARAPQTAPADTLESAFAAARSNDLGLIAGFLAAGYSPNTPNGRRDTLLSVAAYHGSLDVVARLIAEPEIELEGRNRLGLTALAAAAFKGHDEVLEALLDAGADPNATNGAGQTALMFAALAGRTRSVEILRNAGASASLADAAGNTAMTLARGQNATGAVGVLRGAPSGVQSDAPLPRELE